MQLRQMKFRRRVFTYSVRRDITRAWNAEREIQQKEQNKIWQ